MADNSAKSSRRGLPRGLTASLAGLRAGGALAVDSAWQRVRGGSANEEGSAFAQREARRFVAELGQLKGTYVKIGQMLALFGEHFLPRVLTDALHELGADTKALPWAEVEPAFREQLGDHFDALIIEPEAIAAASLAQVHRATERSSGATLALKLQYPGLAEVIDADFDTVVRMLLLARWLKTGRELDEWLESMRQHLHHEIDYRREARLTAEMASLVSAADSTVAYRVPALHPQYCNDRLLAMDFVSGWPVNHPDIARLSLQRRNALAQGMLELFFYELYDWGLLQTDPNFGNYLVDLEDRRLREAADELVLLDFGSALDCGPEFLRHLREMIAAGQRGDREGLVAGLIGLGCLTESVDPDGQKLFADFCLHLLEPLRPPESLPGEYLNAQGEYCWAKSRLMQRAGKLGAQSAASRHFIIPSRDFALIVRKLTGVFTFITVLGAEFNAYSMVQQHIDRWQESQHGA